MSSPALPALGPARARHRVDDLATPRILCVDDEPQVLESLRDSLRRRFEVVATTNGFQALRMLTEQPCDVVVSDMRMPMLNGARFLTLAREHAPDTVRLLLTGQSTIGDAVAAVNDGEIFRFLVKPCPMLDLIAALDSAVVRRRALVAERQLADQSLQHTIRALTAMSATIDPKGPARAERIRRQAVELATSADATVPAAELECACELLQVGAVALSSPVRAHLAQGSRLGREQATELECLPELSERFVRLIPQLAPVAATLSAMAQPLVLTRHGVAGTPLAARVLRLVLDFDLLEEQGVPIEAALRMLRERTGRYDPALLDTFASLQELA